MREGIPGSELLEKDGLPFFREVVCSKMLAITAGEWADKSSFRADMDIQTIGRFSIATLDTVIDRAARTKANVATFTEDPFVVLMVTRSSQWYKYEFDELEQYPGDVAIRSKRWRFEAGARDGFGYRALTIPHNVMAPLLAGRDLRRPLTFRAGTPMAGLIGSGLQAAAANVGRLAPGVAEAALQNLTALIALACGASSQGQDSGRTAVREARLMDVRRFIQSNLADPDLTPDRIAASQRMSTRYLHGLFAPSGESVSAFIMKRRLAACHATLSGPFGRHRTVSEVAYAWGFNSLATFHRAFQGAFGISPGELRALGPTDVGEDALRATEFCAD